MPRKQRFKPSRKPKPIPQAEAAAIGHAVVHHENAEPMAETSRMRDTDPSHEPDNGQGSR
jgi:hypothetical protein